MAEHFTGAGVCTTAETAPECQWPSRFPPCSCHVQAKASQQVCCSASRRTSHSSWWPGPSLGVEDWLCFPTSFFLCFYIPIPSIFARATTGPTAVALQAAVGGGPKCRAALSSRSSSSWLLPHSFSTKHLLRREIGRGKGKGQHQNPAHIQGVLKGTELDPETDLQPVQVGIALPSRPAEDLPLHLVGVVFSIKNKWLTMQWVNIKTDGEVYFCWYLHVFVSEYRERPCGDEMQTGVWCYLTPIKLALSPLVATIQNCWVQTHSVVLSRNGTFSL